MLPVWQNYHSSHNLFEKVCELDLEGIVAKRKDSPYKVTEKPSRHWIKVKNSRYGPHLFLR
jgi:ATP-dependent DNA ligase